MVKKIKKLRKRKLQLRRRAKKTFPQILPVLPAKDIVAFPAVMMSLHVGRAQSVRAVEVSMKRDKLLFIVAQQDPEKEDPRSEELHTIGVIANVVRTLQAPDGRHKVLLQGLARARAVEYFPGEEYLSARIEAIPSDTCKMTAGDEVIVNRVRENLQILVEYEHLPEEMLLVTEEIEDPGVLADVIIAHYKLDPHQAQSVLEETDSLKRLRKTDTIISDDLKQFLISEQIRDRARDEMTKGQREFYLREQIRQIQRELGDEDGVSSDVSELKARIRAAELPEHAHAEAMKQIGRLERMQMESSEYPLLRTYVEWIADLPWSKVSSDKLNLKAAQKILNQDHFGLEKIKERILEYLSVRKLNPQSKGPILCFVGPPGVGKTSLGMSIAKALGRKFHRVSLGGVRDEAEIRGHRRTYIGALPGCIIQGLKQTGSRNPVFVLDELDKVGSDFRGDPASALLEVLDPQQNKDFMDHYLNIKFDLSHVLFIATANIMDTVPPALNDRLEVIFLSGYTTEEKEKIAQRFLIPRQLKENGLEKLKIRFDRKTILYLIERYTSEAGVRNLEREIGSLCRKLARKYTERKRVGKVVEPSLVQELLGPTKFDADLDDRKDAIGLARGLAWTMHGGEVMPVEVSIAKGKGNLNLTGQLGSVMQESAKAAVSYARSNAEALGLDHNFYEKLDIHIHVPGGATPKDGPSAGITIATALVSALARRRVRWNIAMTGEITLRGGVMKVGGLKEKALAALRHGIEKVIIPYENIKDLEEVPKEQRAKIKFIPVKHVSEVLQMALVGESRILAPALKRKAGARTAHA